MDSTHPSGTPCRQSDFRLGICQRQAEETNGSTSSLLAKTNTEGKLDVCTSLQVCCSSLSIRSVRYKF